MNAGDQSFYFLFEQQIEQQFKKDIGFIEIIIDVICNVILGTAYKALILMCRNRSF